MHYTRNNTSDLCRLLLIFLFFGLSSTILSQDLIVRSNNDSVNCRIERVDSAAVFFSIKVNNKEVSTKLPIESVLHYQEGYYDELLASRMESLGGLKGAKSSFEIDGGLGILLGNAPEDANSDMQDLIAKLRTGYQLGVNYSYYFSHRFGVGATYNYFGSKAISDDFRLEQDGELIIRGDAAYSIRDHFIGAQYIMRNVSSNGLNQFTSAFGVGAVIYREDFVMNSHEVNLKAKTLAGKAEIGYDFGLSYNTSIGFKMNVMLGAIKKATIIDDNGKSTTIDVKDESGEFLSASRINFSIVLKFFNYR